MGSDDNNLSFDDLLDKIKLAASDYVRNEEPYKSFVEERSGFSSGVEWTLKKLRKMGLLKVQN